MTSAPIQENAGHGQAAPAEPKRPGLGRRAVMWLDDRINPIVLKELRQNAQSNVLATIIVLVMVVALFIVGIGVGSRQESSGMQTFAWLNGFMVVVCAFVIPGVGAMRMLGEVNDTHGDLLSISTISPLKFVMGKIGATLLISAMVFGTSLPFLTVCYYLNGVSIPLMLLVIWLDAMVITVCVVFSICIVGKDANPVTRFIGVLAQPATLVPVFMLIAFVGSGAGRMTPDFKEVMVVLAHLFVFGLVFCTLGVAAAVVRLLPESSNRSALARPALMLVILGSGAYLLVMDKLVYPWVNTGGRMSFRGEDAMRVWVAGASVLLLVSLMAIIAGRDQYGARVRNMIPKTNLSRFGAFLLYSGAGGGVMWWLVMVAVVLAAGSLWALSLGKFNFFSGSLRFEKSEMLWLAPMRLGLYVFLYAMTGVLLRHYFLRSWAKPAVATVIAIVLMIFSVLVPVLTGFFNNGPGRTPGMEQAENLMWAVSPAGMLLDEPPVWAVAGFLSIWGTLVVIAGIPWLWFHWASFTRLEPDAKTQEALIRSSKRGT